MQQDDYYSILKCSHTATFEELKYSYQKLIKEHHPDKISNKQLTNDTFIKIDKAWKVLKDPIKRKEYDASLLQSTFDQQCLIYAEIMKNHLVFEDDQATYTCRCGNDIVILKEYLNEDECIVECSECTNCVVIK